MDNLPLSGLPTGTTLENNATIVTVQTVGGTVVNQRVPKSLFFSQALTGALIAANNLSDIADKAIALANLGVHNLQYSAGTAAPTGTLGNIGDFAFNDNFEWYEKTAATTWILRVNGVTSAELTTATTGMLTQATADTRYAPLEGAAQSGLRYNYSSTTTFPSTSGEIRFNNAAIASVTQINIHESDRNSASNADVLAILGIGSRIQVALESNEEVYAWFRVTGAPTDNGTDRTIPVSVISSVGTFSAGEVSIGVIGGAGGGGGAVPVGSIYYQWATSIAASDPTAGFIKANNASVDLATTIYVSETDVETSNRATLLSQVTAGGILRIQKVSDGAYVDFTVATNTDNGAWRSIAGVFSAGSNSPLLSLAANDSVVLAWLPPTSSGGGATGLQYTYLNTAGTPASGQIRSTDIAFVGPITVSISATDAQTSARSTADVLARLKTGAIIEIAASQANKVRGTITADYASGANSFNWSGQIVSGAIANNATVYLSIISDALSAATGGAGGHIIQDEGADLPARAKLNIVGAGVTATDDPASDRTVITVANSSSGGLTIVEEIGSTATIASNTIVKSNRATAQTLSAAGAAGIIGVQGIGEGIWSIKDGIFIAPDGASNSGVRRKSTHRYAGVELINIGGSNWAIRHPADLTGIELFAVASGDARVTDYFAAITAAGGTFTGGDQAAFANALTALDLITPWADVACWYPMIGGTLNSMRIDAKDPTNTAQYIAWNAANTASSAGVLISANAFVPIAELVPSATSQLSTVVSVSGMSAAGTYAVFFSSLNDDYSLVLEQGAGIYRFSGRGFMAAGGGPFWPAGGAAQTFPFAGSVVASTQPNQLLRVVAASGSSDSVTPRTRTNMNVTQGIRLGGSTGGGASPAYTYKGFLAVKSSAGLTLSQDQALYTLAANLQTALGRS